MKRIILMTFCLASLAACRCEVDNDEAQKQNDLRIKNDTLKVK
ncbi:hypothetical protein J2T03_000045 [Chryseobacterium lathyri]|nr:hypothetical protein [Chryseobacterium lathyri]